MRYEDLVNDAKNTYEGIFKYLLEIEDIDGTNVQRRIEEVVKAGRSATQTYKFKATTGQLNASANRYTPEQTEFIKSELGDLLYFFGYSNVDEESYSNFYHFAEHSEERRALHNGFKKVNEDAMQEVLARPRQYKSYSHNRNRDMVELLQQVVIERAQEPGLLFAKSCLEKASG